MVRRCLITRRGNVQTQGMFACSDTASAHELKPRAETNHRPYLDSLVIDQVLSDSRLPVLGNCAQGACRPSTVRIIFDQKRGQGLRVPRMAKCSDRLKPKRVSSGVYDSPSV